MALFAEKTIDNRDFLRHEYQILIPTNIFLDRRIAILEALVEYLKEEYRLKYHEIAELTNRDQRNIRTVYERVKQKRTDRIKFDTADFYFKLDIVKNRELSIFEAIILHLRAQGATNKQLSKIFDRSAKTLSTIYTRAKKKSENKPIKEENGKER